MKTSTRAAAGAFIVLVNGATAQDRGKALEQEAERRVGQVATLCGLVVNYECQPPDRTSLLELEKYPGRGVSVAIARKDRGKFGTLLESRSVLREVCATGPVEKQKNRYLVRVEQPDQLTLRGESTSAVPFGADSVSVCDVGVEQPKILKTVKPQYTLAASVAGIRGIIVLEAAVLTDGRVGEIRVLRSLDTRYGLDAEAIKGVRAWTFVPGTLDGKTAPVVVTIEVSFGP